MKTQKRLFGRGGPDRGQGRKPIAGVVATEIIAVRATPDEKVKFAALGGAKWFRRALQRAKVKTSRGA